jgi:hypothetical protein
MVGKAQSGKDTFAEVLVREGGYVRMAFADELKRDVAAFLGITTDELEERKNEFRTALQAYGTRRREQDGRSYWLGRLEPKLTSALDAGSNVVVTDVRYQNEADWIRALGGVLIRRVRKDHRGLTGEQERHSSETEQDGIRVDHTCECDTIKKIQQHARCWMTDGIWSFGCRV